MLRIAAVSGITVTGLVHWFLLRPLLHLDGADFVADNCSTWSCRSWRRRLAGVRAAPAHRLGGLPARDRLAARLAGRDPGVGRATGWYPYPFLDHREHGWDHVAVVCAGIFVLFFALFAAMRDYDRRRAPAPVTGS